MKKIINEFKKQGKSFWYFFGKNLNIIIFIFAVVVILHMSVFYFQFGENILSLIIIIIGWFVSNYFSSKRNIDQKKRDIATKYLIESYIFLTTEISHRDIRMNDREEKLENLISNIQLFGTFDQISLVEKLISEYKSNNEFELDPLINSLRKSLRVELGLKQIKENVKWVRHTKQVINKSENK